MCADALCSPTTKEFGWPQPFLSFKQTSSSSFTLFPITDNAASTCKKSNSFIRARSSCVFAAFHLASRRTASALKLFRHVLNTWSYSTDTAPTQDSTIAERYNRASKALTDSSTNARVVSLAIVANCLRRPFATISVTGGKSGPAISATSFLPAAVNSHPLATRIARVFALEKWREMFHPLAARSPRPIASSFTSDTCLGHNGSCAKQISNLLRSVMSDRASNSLIVSLSSKPRPQLLLACCGQSVITPRWFV